MSEKRQPLTYPQCLETLASNLQTKTTSNLIEMIEKLGKKEIVRTLLSILLHAEMEMIPDIIIGKKQKKKMLKKFFSKEIDDTFSGMIRRLNLSIFSWLFKRKDDDAKSIVIKEVKETFMRLNREELFDLLKT